MDDYVYSSTPLVATTQSMLDVYDASFDKLMKLSKEDLVRMIIGERPIFGPVSYFISDSTTPFHTQYV